VDLSGRTSETRHFVQLFAHDHLPPHLQGISRQCHDLAMVMLEELPDGYQLASGLQKLLEAKDCFVRAALSRSS